jgi:hypothetical protein
MLRLVLEQVFAQLFERALQPLDRERIRRLVREAIETDRPDLLREIVRELSFVAPVERSVRDWFDRMRAGGSSEPEGPQGPDDPKGDPP